MGQEPKKYHITDDGEVFKINEDGSFTKMGNAENINNTASSDSAPAIDKDAGLGKYSSPEPQRPKPQKSNGSKKLIWLLIALIIVAAAVIAILLLPEKRAEVIDEAEQEEIVEAVVTEESDADDATLQEAEAPAQKEEIAPEKPERNEAEVTNPATSPSPAKPKQEDYSQYEKPAESPQVPQPQQSYQPRVNQSSDVDPNRIYEYVEVSAEYPGGDGARIQWLRDNMVWPRDEEGYRMNGKVYLEFVIERDGSVSNVKVMGSNNSALNSEAVRLISSMPRWIPAKYHNEPVRSQMGITLFF